MLDPDKQLIRGQDGDFTNLAIGEPIFLQRHMAHVVPSPPSDPWMPLYPPYRGIPELIKALEKENPGHYVVIANGAKQALAAAFYALRGPGIVSHSTPHWPSYPTLVKLHGSVFCGEVASTHTGIYCVTSPNNPDGSMVQSGDSLPYDVWDAVYAHWVYEWNHVKPIHKVSVWSAAKLFGLSGERVGWALTKDESLAMKMADYVEKTTSGVNVRAQIRVAQIVANENHGAIIEAYCSAADDLRSNRLLFEEHIEPHTTYSSYSVGMFAWFKTKDPEVFRDALKCAKVMLVDGKACGATEDGWFRMSLGQSPEVQKSALERLGQELSYG